MPGGVCEKLILKQRFGEGEEPSNEAALVEPGKVKKHSYAGSNYVDNAIRRFYVLIKFSSGGSFRTNLKFTRPGITNYFESFQTQLK